MHIQSDIPTSQTSESNAESAFTDDEPEPSSPSPVHKSVGFFDRVKAFFVKPDEAEHNDEALREAIEEYIEEPQGFNTDSVSVQERLLFSNILKMRDVSVANVMIPRVDITAIDADTPREDLLNLICEHRYSRFPIFTGALDDVLGTVHIKDILATIAQDKDIHLRDIITEVPIVPPSMPILDLVLQMRHKKRHMALVVDEYGGIDGLITIADVIESIIGEIDDEHDTENNEPQITETQDGSLIADARVSLDAFEENYGRILDDDERQESDTLGGLVFDLAGRVPVRGEVITHPTGMIFEILDADPRRIKRVKVANIPPFDSEPSEDDSGN